MKDGEADALFRIDQQATKLFEPWFPALLEHEPSIAEFSAMLGGRGVWVAVDAHDKPVGFAVAGDLDGVFWLYQMSVAPEHGKKGVGTALLQAVIDHAKWAFYNAVGLTTFRQVAFNQAFYQKFGFMSVDPKVAPESVANQFAVEVPKDVLPAARVLMIRKL